jgi:hypothetical protein
MGKLETYLRAMCAPQNVLDAAIELDSGVESQELASYVRDWVSKQWRNNRYGK